MKKIITIGTLLSLSLMTLTACTSEQTVQQPKIEKEKEGSYSNELSGFIYQNEKEPLYFAGTLGYLHSVNVKELKKEQNQLRVTSEIALYEVMEDETEENKDIYKQDVIYTIDKDSVREELEEAQYDDPKNMILNKVVLKTPLKEGNHWSQEVILGDGEEYLADTKIEKITGEKGERNISTVTTVKAEGFEDYPNQQYEERAVYQEGKGLVSFERFFPNEAGGFVFEYHLDEQKTSEHKKDKE
ncbi:hypothetical protein CVD28_00160 [Bacillus sp. M6-12]|uniref:hypothetical protein n=1 Tax=Bacillus sp. M6-12 TaxID=2054166 RepID=UPI000C75AC9E|nr:hypothetical protein [Bacillus sp. M6-12]PLS18849.1 hypothetical protein CVD28_00160 [Bacillus sp. M6-12]